MGLVGLAVGVVVVELVVQGVARGGPLAKGAVVVIPGSEVLGGITVVQGVVGGIPSEYV